MDINLERLKKNLFELAKIGFNEEDNGIYRQGFSDADFQARDWLMALAEQYGFASKMDEAGNVVIQYGDAETGILIGSHMDTVPAGGMFDGALGVLAGLECLCRLKEEGTPLKHHIKVIGTSEEEGRFGGMFGVQALTGDLTPEHIRNNHDADGIMLKDAMAAQGLDPMAALNAALPFEKIVNFFELHIEQGPVLFEKNIQIGIVEGISGVFKWIVTLKGKADHAGTAPMDMRSDAFMGLADFAHEIQRIIDEDGTNYSRITVGKAELKPGFPHTIAGEVDFTLVVRDMDAKIMEGLSNACHKALSAIARRHKLQFSHEQVSWLDPANCSDSVIDFIEDLTKQRGYSYIRMPSGAGHDTQFFAEKTQAGMIFIPSVNGVSHAPDEWSHWHDVENGTNLLLDCIYHTARKD